MGVVKVISAWPATGKSTLALQYPILNYHELKCNGNDLSDWIKDLDSAVYKAHFSDSNWVDGYVTMIKDFYQQGFDDGGRTMLLIASHNQVQQSLVENGIPFTIVMPIWNAQYDYIKQLGYRAIRSQLPGDEAAYKYMDANFAIAYPQAVKFQKDHKNLVNLIKLDTRTHHLADIYDQLWED